MSTITLDKDIYQKLPTLHEATEIRDAAGKVLGIYTPLEDSLYNQQISQHILDLFDDQEMERRSQSTHPGYSLKEVWEHIHALEKQG